MRPKIVVLAAACVSGLALLLIPSHFSPAVAALIATSAFGLYALRERGALRGLRDSLGRLAGELKREIDAVTDLRRELDEQRQATTEIRESQNRLLIEQAAFAQDMLKQQAALTHESNDVVRSGLSTAVAGVNGSLEAIQDRLLDAPTQTELRRLHHASVSAATQDFRQLEALADLRSLFAVRAPLPRSRGWAASPDLLLHLTSLVLAHRPSVIVEAGSGVSTVWLAYALEKSDHGGRIISLDHDEHFAAKTRELVAAHGLSELAEVRHAPLVDVKLNGETWPWYDQAALADVQRCDLLVVDGPPADTRSHARYPALPLLESKLSEDAVVVLDDCIRQEEKDIVQLWRSQSIEWRVEMLDHEKVTAVLRR